MLAVLMMNLSRSISKRRENLKSHQKMPNKVADPAKIQKNIYCRTCMTDQDLVPIFFDQETEQKRSEQLKIVTGLEIKSNDGFSQKMCCKCMNIFKISLQFRHTSKKTEKTLINMVRKKPKKKKIPAEVQPKTEARTEEDFDNCDYHTYEDNFDNCYDDNVKEEEAKQVPVTFEQKPVPTRRKKSTLPNETSYKCTTCNKDFRMKATFKAHMRFHTNYCVCESCGKRCRNYNQLQEHKRARHGLGKIHKCAFCEYSSATKEALTIHERRHTGERPYVCDHCGATFHRRSNLVQHIAIHLPDNNFQCDMCPKRLKSKKFLQIHKHNAHTGRRYGYLCALCGHRFEKPNKVRAHARRVHAVPDDRQPPVVRVRL